MSSAGASPAPVVEDPPAQRRAIYPAIDGRARGRVCERAEASGYEDIGHPPFLEDSARFDRDLHAFAGRAFGDAAGRRGDVALPESGRVSSTSSEQGDRRSSLTSAPRLRQPLGFFDRPSGQKDDVGLQAGLGRPGAAEAESRLARKASERLRVPTEGARVDGADDDDGGVARPCCVGGALEWRIGAEKDDAPSARPQREAERDQSEVVLFARRARQDRARADSSAPASREAEQSTPEERRCEVLLRDRHLAALPALAKLVQVGHDDVP